jgi:hypothetical protein
MSYRKGKKEHRKEGPKHPFNQGMTHLVGAHVPALEKQMEKKAIGK